MTSNELQGGTRKLITGWQREIDYRLASNELQGGTRKYIIGWHQMNYRVAQGNIL